jgi:dTDP-4-dehydrorhamnose 3,5-epimerase
LERGARGDVVIDGVEVKELKKHKDNRGFLMEMLRGSDKIKADGPKAFGQVYLGAVYPGIVKGRHRHFEQDDHTCIIRGDAAIHLEDGREGSKTKGAKQVILAGEQNGWKLVRIPKGVWHSIENIGTDVCWLVNYVTREYDPKKPDEERGDFDVKEKKMPWDVLKTG